MLYCILIFITLMPVTAYSLENIAVLKQYLPDNPIILEAGAHTGSDTIKLSAMWPQGTVHAFEPLPELFEELKHATAYYRNVKVYQLALSDSSGLAQLYVSKVGTGSSSLLPPKDHLQVFHWIEFPFSIEVPTVTIDQWMQQENINKIDLLWLDLQGLEYKVLNACPNILRQVRVIATEVNFRELYAGCVLYSAYKKWLESHGFIQVFIEQPHPSWADAVFVNTWN